MNTFLSYNSIKFCSKILEVCTIKKCVSMVRIPQSSTGISVCRLQNEKHMNEMSHYDAVLLYFLVWKIRHLQGVYKAFVGRLKSRLLTPASHSTPLPKRLPLGSTSLFSVCMYPRARCRFTAAKIWTQIKCPSVDEMDKEEVIHTHRHTN